MHKNALFSFMWLFLGFIIAFSFWYVLLQDQTLFNAQIETYCAINNPGGIEDCISRYSFEDTYLTGSATKEIRLLSIISNNVYVMLFTLIEIF